MARVVIPTPITPAPNTAIRGKLALSVIAGLHMFLDRIEDTRVEGREQLRLA